MHTFKTSLKLDFKLACHICDVEEGATLTRNPYIAFFHQVTPLNPINNPTWGNFLLHTQSIG